MRVLVLATLLAAVSSFGSATSMFAYQGENGELPKWELYVPPADGSDEEMLKHEVYDDPPFTEADLPLATLENGAAAPGYDKNLAMSALYYSKAAYCPAPNVNAWNCAACKFHGQMSSMKVFTFFDLQAYVGYNGAARQIVVAFRGSSNIANWISNLVFAKTPYALCNNQCSVHTGFYDLWKGLRADMINAVRGLATVYPTAALVVTGHSLGGAVSLHAALDLKASLPSIKEHHFYNFGEPRVGDEAFAKYAAGALPNGRQFRVVHKADPVPHLPPMALGFRHAPREIFYNNDGSTSYVECNDSAAGEDKKCSNQYIIPAGIADHLKYLGLGTNCAAN